MTLTWTKYAQLTTAAVREHEANGGFWLVRGGAAQVVVRKITIEGDDFYLSPVTPDIRALEVTPLSRDGEPLAHAAPATTAPTQARLLADAEVVALTAIVRREDADPTLAAECAERLVAQQRRLDADHAMRIAAEEAVARRVLERDRAIARYAYLRDAIRECCGAPRGPRREFRTWIESAWRRATGRELPPHVGVAIWPARPHPGYSDPPVPAPIPWPELAALHLILGLPAPPREAAP